MSTSTLRITYRIGTRVGRNFEPTRILHRMRVLTAAESYLNFTVQDGRGGLRRSLAGVTEVLASSLSWWLPVVTRQTFGFGFAFGGSGH